MTGDYVNKKINIFLNCLKRVECSIELKKIKREKVEKTYKYLLTLKGCL